MPTRTTLANIQARLFDRLVPDGDCLVWPGAHNHFGHGFIKFDGRNQSVHRLVWLLINGEIPGGLCVLHHCDNPPCCRIEHLFLGTKKDNNEDRDRKGRQKHTTHCPRGHSYDEHGVIWSGALHCRECNRIRNRNRRS